MERSVLGFGRPREGRSRPLGSLAGVSYSEVRFRAVAITLIATVASRSGGITRFISPMRSGVNSGYRAACSTPLRDVLTDPDVGETHLLDLRGEGTLRQGSRHSPRPCSVVRLQLARKLVVDREVGNCEAAIRPKDTADLGQDSRFARREVNHAVRDHHVD